MSEDAMVIPDGISPIVGWRAWEVEGGQLVSPIYKLVWPVRQRAEARCVPSPSMSYFPRPVFFVRPYAGSEFDLASGQYRVNIGPRNGEGMPHPDGPSIIVTSPIPWPDAKNCYEHDECPSKTCSCGFYVTKDPNEAMKHGQVIGRVAVWGNVVEHDTGWRGQYAYPQALYVKHPKLLRVQLADYGVPILPLSEIIGKAEEIEAARISWYEWPLRWLAVVGWVALIQLSFWAALSYLWWGATGETLARQMLAVLAGTFQGVVALWWIRWIPKLLA